MTPPAFPAGPLPIDDEARAIREMSERLRRKGFLQDKVTDPSTGRPAMRWARWWAGHSEVVIASADGALAYRVIAASPYDDTKPFTVPAELQRWRAIGGFTIVAEQLLSLPPVRPGHFPSALSMTNPQAGAAAGRTGHYHNRPAPPARPGSDVPSEPGRGAPTRFESAAHGGSRESPSHSSSDRGSRSASCSSSRGSCPGDCSSCSTSPTSDQSTLRRRCHQSPTPEAFARQQIGTRALTTLAHEALLARAIGGLVILASRIVLAVLPILWKRGGRGG